MAKPHQPIPFAPRHFMELAIQEMQKSMSEPRDDGKHSPKVGAVLVRPDGTFEVAHRCELRHGDHAEFTLIERKLRSERLDGSILFATLEPCAPGARKHPKLPCAERIFNARIAEVWVGIEDPDPTVDGKGIRYLEEQGIKVHLFDPDLQKVIRAENADFIRHAEERAKTVGSEPPKDLRSSLEKAEPRASFGDLSRPELEAFIEKARLGVTWGSEEFYRTLQQLGLIEIKESDQKEIPTDQKSIPTGIGILLFGKRPQLLYPQAAIKASFKLDDQPADMKEFTGSLISQARQAEEWFDLRIQTQIQREKLERDEIRGFPMQAFREALINALIHRDYEIGGAQIHITLNDEHFVVKSPGKPAHPVTVEDLQSLNASTFSRSPQILYVFNQMDLAEQRGLGQETFRTMPNRYHLPKPTINFKEPYLELVFDRAVSGKSSLAVQHGTLLLTPEEAAGLDFIQEQKHITKKQYAQRFGYSDRQAERHLAKFKSLELIQSRGRGRSTSYTALI